jgi:predicted Zn-dependent peptidase
MLPGADLNSLYLRGSAPAGKLTLTLKALISLSNERSLNRTEADAFLRNGTIGRQSVQDRLEALLTPRYQYSAGQLPGVLSEETLSKAGRYFQERFSQVNDGILLLSGPQDPDAVKKVLLRYLGSFQTEKDASTSRKQVHFRTLSGINTYAEDGPDQGLYVLMDADYPLTALNYPASLIAAEAVRGALATHLADENLAVTVEPRFIAYPQERLRLLIQCRPAGPAKNQADFTSALTAVRNGLQEAASRGVSPKDLSAWKQFVLNQLQSQLSTTEGTVATLLARYAAGKDLTSRYKENVEAVTADRVNAILKALVSGGRIEYLVP